MSITPEQRIKFLEDELRHALADLADCRRKLGENSVHAKRIDRAYVNALKLAMLHVAYLPTSRDYAKVNAGMTHNQWENAMALLRMGLCVEKGAWVLHDLDTIEYNLIMAKDRALAEPAAFRVRLPKHTRPELGRASDD